LPEQEEFEIPWSSYGQRDDTATTSETNGIPNDDESEIQSEMVSTWNNDTFVKELLRVFRREFIHKSYLSVTKGK